MAAHREDARNEIVEILRGLTFLEDGVRDALIDAAWRHDDGKLHEIVQAAFGREPGEVPLAKSKPDFKNASLVIRHEQHIPDQAEFEALPELVQYLCPSTHAYGRGGFPYQSSLKLGQAGIDTCQKSFFLFLKLMEAYGPWRLAYFQALVKAADHRASQKGARVS